MLDVALVRDGLSVLVEEVRAPPELLTLDLGDEPVGPLLELVVPDAEVVAEVVLVPDVLVPDADEVVPDVVLVPDAEVVPEVVLVPDAEVVPDVDGLLDDDGLPDEDADEAPDDEVELDAPVSALPGAATARAVPPRAAMPKVNRAAVLAIRVLNIDFLFCEPPGVAGREKDRARPSTKPQRRCPCPPKHVRHALGRRADLRRYLPQRSGRHPKDDGPKG